MPTGCILFLVLLQQESFLVKVNALLQCHSISCIHKSCGSAGKDQRGPRGAGRLAQSALAEDVLRQLGPPRAHGDRVAPLPLPLLARGGAPFLVPAARAHGAVTLLARLQRRVEHLKAERPAQRVLRHPPEGVRERPRLLGRAPRRPHQPHPPRAAPRPPRGLRPQVQLAEDADRGGHPDAARQQHHRLVPAVVQRRAVGAVHVHHHLGQGLVPGQRGRPGRQPRAEAARAHGLDVVRGDLVRGRAAQGVGVPLPRGNRGDVDEHVLAHGVRDAAVFPPGPPAPAGHGVLNLRDVVPIDRYGLHSDAAEPAGEAQRAVEQVQGEAAQDVVPGGHGVPQHGHEEDEREVVRVVKPLELGPAHDLARAEAQEDERQEGGDDREGDSPVVTVVARVREVEDR
mmetsp:Transcript_36534/g.63383  ORF Transcript_36534/g.63383 Transcript_36534/m.63383 type:complete len:399 (+) Transcript_36534:364-1560(+)